MHEIVQDAIEGWQSSNTGKWENFTVGNDPRRMRATESILTVISIIPFSILELDSMMTLTYINQTVHMVLEVFQTIL